MNDEAWYVTIDGQMHGPVPMDEIRALAERGDIGRDTLAWRHPMNEWRPIRALPELAARIPPPLPSEEGERLRRGDAAPVMPGPGRAEPPPLPGTDPTGETDEPERRWSDGGAAREKPELRAMDDGGAEAKPHPWRRFFARVADYSLFALPGGMLIMFPLAFVSPDGMAWMMEQDDWVAVMLIVAAFVPVEGWMLSRWGATPGKWMFSLRVEGKWGEQIDFAGATRRALHVWARGMGFAIPAVSVITQLVAGWKLEKKGETKWDQDLELAVRAGKLSTGKIALFVALMLVAFYGYGATA